MTFRRELHATVAVVTAALLVAPPARALVSMNDGRDKIYVSAAASVTRDSNILANSDSPGDYVYTTTLGAEYTRRAGWIGVNAAATVMSSRFGEQTEQNFDNPSFNLEFTKQSGRTTGSLTLSAMRESRADAEVNIRSTSWVVPVGLNFKYPIVGTYTLAGNFGYSSRRYLDEAAFTNLTTYQASVDLLHLMSTERDLIAGYRYRFSDTSRKTSSTDHSFSLGLNGRLVRGVKGFLRVGYQYRTSTGVTSGDTDFEALTASGSALYAFSKKMNVTGIIAKDFWTTAKDSFVDTTTASLNWEYAYSSRWSLTASVSAGDSRFLGDSGRVILALGPPLVLGPQRHDNNLGWSASVNYSLNEHFKADLTYAWFENWSTLAFADFVRSSWTLNMSTRW